MADPNNKWNQPAAPPPPMFFGKKERDLVKQVNDELAERVIGQPIAYYPISIEESNFNDIYGESIDKVSLPPVRVYAYVVVENEQTNERYGYEYQTKLTVNFSSKRLTADQNLYVRVGDFVQYGDFFYEIVRTYNDTRYYFGQVEHKFQIGAECVRAREGAFRVVPGLDRPVTAPVGTEVGSSPAPRELPYPPLNATYITVTANSRLPYERVLAAGSGISLTDGGAGGALTIAASGQNAVGPSGSLQFQTGGGSFSGSANLTFLTGSTRLGIGTATPTHTLTVMGSMSASADVRVGGNLIVRGTVVGASPLKISGSINIVNNAGTTIAILGSSSLGPDVLSSSLGVLTNLTASGLVSASYFYGDGSNLTNVASTGTATGQGPAGALQFVTGSGGISGSATILYNSSSNNLTINSGLIHKRQTVAATYTASVSDYILGVTSVPVNILFDATTFSNGQVVVVKDESGAASSGNPITLNASASQTVDGAGSAVIESPYGAVLLYSDGSDWFVY
jgi:hypothetical protein